jgi:hypothetical protein
MSVSPTFTRRIGVITMCAMLAACSGKSAARTDSASATGSVAPADSAAGTMTMVRGSVASASATTLSVQGDSGTVSVQLAQPLRVYERQPARLDEVTPNTFIGVTTVKQPDGSDQATEIHIFPEELRGLGEGSRPMAAASSGGAGSTMTNGTMTNGNASSPQMSNGSASRVGSALVVQYAGGSMKANVPASTPVTKLVATSHPLATGDRIVVIATKRPDGALESNRVILAK